MDDSNIEQLLKDATATLSMLDNPSFEAEVLLAHCIEKPRSWLRSWGEKLVSREAANQYHQLIKRRANGEPVAYIIGSQPFWNFELKTTPDTLIPRADSEILVEEALRLIHTDKPQAIADLGTGSGAIAIAIAKERPNCHITATDNSLAALNVAKYNANILKVNNISFINGKWLAPLQDQQFNLIISNPPYIAINDPYLDESTKYEPQSALLSGTDGLDDIRIIIQQAKKSLLPDGILLLEHGWQQAQQIQQLFRSSGWKNIITSKDLAGHDRVAQAAMLQ